jgi:ABC-2 type transport system ATP-binding protein
MNGPDGAAVTVDRLSKRYGDRTVLRDVSLRVDRGEVFGLLGPNGAGKTTTLETIVGLRRPTAGTVRVLGRDPSVDRRYVTERMAVQPQAATLFPTLTVAETLDLFASFHHEARRPEEVLDELDLGEARRLRVKHLSGGQERRLLIAIALIGDPEIVVLDEPSAGLDPQARRNLWDIIRRQQERGTTILLSTHHMDEATRVCDRIAVLVDGSIAATGAPETLVREHAVTATVTFEIPGRTTADELRSHDIPGEITVTEQGTVSLVAIETDDPDAVLRRLTFSTGLRPRGFRVAHGSLEDLFVDLANRPTSVTEGERAHRP